MAATDPTIDSRVAVDPLHDLIRAGDDAFGALSANHASILQHLETGARRRRPGLSAVDGLRKLIAQVGANQHFLADLAAVADRYADSARSQGLDGSEVTLGAAVAQRLIDSPDLIAPAVIDASAENHCGEVPFWRAFEATPQRWIDLHSGNFGVADSDLPVQGGSLVHAARRFYNSRASSRRGLFGFGWSSLLDMAVESAGPGRKAIIFEDGRRVVCHSIDTTNTTFVGRLNSPSAPAGAEQITLSSNNGDGWTLVAEGRRSWTFSDQGKLLAHRRSGYGLSIERSDDLIEVSAQEGTASLTFVLDGGLIQSVRDHRDRRAEYRYSVANDLLGVNRPDGRCSYVVQSGLVVAIVAAGGDVQIKNRYDALGRVDEQTAEGRTLRFLRATVPTLASATATIVVEQDAGVASPSTDGGETVRLAVVADRHGRLVARIDGAQLRHAGTDLGRLLAEPAVQNALDRATQPLGETAVPIEGADRRLVICDAEGEHEVYWFDDGDRLVAISRAEGPPSTWLWTDGDLAETRSGERLLQATTTHREQETGERSVTILDASGSPLDVEFDRYSNPVRVVDADGVGLDVEWDDESITRIRNGVDEVSLGYDATGAVVSFMAGERSVVEVEADSAGRPLVVRTPLGQETLSYGTSGSVDAGACADGSQWRLTTNPAGQVETIERTWANGTKVSVRHRWDERGVLTERRTTLAEGHVLVYRWLYDQSLRATSLTIERESVSPESGAIVEHLAVIIYGYDRDGELGTVTTTFDGAEPRAWTRRRIDRQIDVVGPGDRASDTRSVVIDTVGRPVHLVVAEASLDFACDEHDRLVRGSSASAERDLIEVWYSPAGRLGAVRSGSGPTGAMSWSWAYDRQGAVTRMTGEADARIVARRSVASRGTSNADGFGKEQAEHDAVQPWELIDIDCDGQRSVLALDWKGSTISPEPGSLRWHVPGRERPAGWVESWLGDVDRHLVDPKGPLVLTSPSGQTESLIGRTDRVHVWRDGLGQVVETASVNAAGSYHRRYWRDELGRIQQVDGCVAGDDPHFEVAYRYDQEGRLGALHYGDDLMVEILYDHTREIGAYRIGGIEVAPPSQWDWGNDTASRDTASRQFVDDQGRISRYDEQGRVVDVFGMDGASRVFTYRDASSAQIAQAITPAGRFDLDYDQGRVVRVEDPQRGSVWFQTDDAGHRREDRASDGSATAFYWNEFGWLTDIVVNTTNNSDRHYHFRNDADGRPILVVSHAEGASRHSSIRWDVHTDAVLGIAGQRYLRHHDGQDEWVAVLEGLDRSDERLGLDWTIGFRDDPWGFEYVTGVHLGLGGRLAVDQFIFIEGGHIFDTRTRSYITPAHPGLPDGVPPLMRVGTPTSRAEIWRFPELYLPDLEQPDTSLQLPGLGWGWRRWHQTAAAIEPWLDPKPSVDADRLVSDQVPVELLEGCGARIEPWSSGITLLRSARPGYPRIRA